MPSVETPKLRIVVLDDEPLVLAGVSMLLESLGHQVFRATNGEQVLQFVRDGQRFDLGILDLTIRNGQGGQEIAPDLLLLDPDMKLVVTSGYRADDIMTDCGEYGFHEALPKPFGRFQLSELLNRLFAFEP